MSQANQVIDLGELAPRKRAEVALEDLRFWCGLFFELGQDELITRPLQKTRPEFRQAVDATCLALKKAMLGSLDALRVAADDYSLPSATQKAVLDK